MSRDEIVEEVRRERDKIAASFGYDLERMFRALEEEQNRGGRTVVSLPPKKATPAPASSR
jgi:hypothetical protein